MEEREAVIIIRDLSKAFGDNVVLNGFNLNVYRGENVVVLGKSGSGKSVLIKCIIGLLKPDSGYIEVLGSDVSVLPPIELDKLRARVGFYPGRSCSRGGPAPRSGRGSSCSSCGTPASTG